MTKPSGQNMRMPDCAAPSGWAGQVAIVQRTNSFGDTFERSIAKDRHNKHLRRKAYTAIAAKMARTVHGIIKHGEPDLPLL